MPKWGVFIRVLVLVSCATTTAAAFAASVPVTSNSIAIASIKIVSTNSEGDLANGNSDGPVFSPDGNSIAFNSEARNLIPGITAPYQIYLKNLSDGSIRCVSCNSAGEPADFLSYGTTFSPDGNFIAFYSYAYNLSASQQIVTPQVYIKNLSTNQLRLVSTAQNGRVADDGSAYPRFSPNGKSIAFVSSGKNLVANDVNGVSDVFIKNLATGKVDLVSASSDGVQANGYSDAPLRFLPDGSGIFFLSKATNLTANRVNPRMYLYEKTLSTGAVRRITWGNGDTGNYDVARQGDRIAFSSDADNLVTPDVNNVTDIFAINRGNTPSIVRVSSALDGSAGNSISDDPAFMPDGKSIVFISCAKNLIAGGTKNCDVFWRNLQSKQTILISKSMAGKEAGTFSARPVVSPEGKRIAFVSRAANLVPGGSNGASHIFLVTLK